jgi:hypothetical protein
MGNGSAGSRRSDPLERHQNRKLVVLVDSPFLLDLERAVVVSGVVAVLLIFAIRGWAGYFPSKLSTTGAEYGDWPSIDDVSEGGEDTSGAVTEIREDQLALARATWKALSALVADIDALEGRISQHRRMTDQDDML